MIKKFHVLYVGQIELDNIGLNGTPANDRRYSSDRLSEAFATCRDVAQTMDELGFYALWTAEHHFQREGYECLPNLIQLGLWLATQTKRLKFGCAFNVLPMWHPIRLAEDYAMADIVTDGRVIMGVGRGYHTREVETFGAPLLDAEANREYFEEQLQLLLKCFNEEAFYHKGKYFECPPPVPYRGYTLKEITVIPRPKHLPVEIWMPIASGKTIDMMARYGFKAMVTLNGEKILDDVVRAYHDACHRHGQAKALGQDVIWGAGVYLADTVEEAIQRVEPAQRLGVAVGEIDAGAPDHVLPELLAPAVAGARGLIGAHDVIENFFSIERHHCLEIVARHQVDGLAARNRHEDFDRQMLGTRHHGDVG